MPFAVKYGLPVSDHGGWPGVARNMSQKIGCVHIHNHDGKAAHKPLRDGHIDFTPLKELAMIMKGVPLILEADYRGLNDSDVRLDLNYLAGLLDYETKAARGA
jgi:hypothetical protein